MSIGSRLRRMREQRFESLEDVSKVIGVARQTLYKYETGIITNIPSDKIEQLAHHYRVSPSYIMGWEPKAINTGSSYYLDRIKDAFQRINSLGQEKVADYANDLDRSGQYRADRSLDMQDYVETYSDASAAAGASSYNEDNEEFYHQISVRDIPDRFDAQVDVCGDSMEPTIPDGAVAFIDFTVDRPPKDGDIYVFQRGDNTLLKRGYFSDDSWTLTSDNKNADDIKITIEELDTVRVIGRLVDWTMPK